MLPIATGLAVVFSRRFLVQPAFAAPVPTITPEFIQQQPSRSDPRPRRASRRSRRPTSTLRRRVVATGGGMLGGPDRRGANAERPKKAEELIAPLRTALIDYDADVVPAQESAKAALAGVPWLSSAALETFGKDSSPGRPDHLPRRQRHCPGGLRRSTPTICRPSSTPGQGGQHPVHQQGRSASGGKPGKPDDRGSGRRTSPSRSITVAVTLPNADPKDKDANAARWAANNGEPARQACSGVRPAGRAPAAHARTERGGRDGAEGRRRAERRPTRWAGRLVERNGGETLFWANQFVSVAPLS